MGKHKKKHKKSGGKVSIGSGFSYTFKKCHEGNMRIFKDPKSPLVFYGGGKSRDCFFPKDGIVLDLAQNYTPMVVGVGIELPKLSVVPTDRFSIDIYWPDMKGCALTRADWLNIIDTLRKFGTKQAKEKCISEVPCLVCCMGGHGRTGTALAILLGIITNDLEPVEFVREKLCKECVESESQIKYIEDMLGIKIKSKVTKWTSYTNSRIGTIKNGVYIHGTATDKASTDAWLQSLGSGAVSAVGMKPKEEKEFKDDYKGYQEQLKKEGKANVNSHGDSCYVCRGEAKNGFCLGCRALVQECTCLDFPGVL